MTDTTKPDKNPTEIEVTHEMIWAGIRAAKLISFDWGLDDEGDVVSRVYRAMVCAKDQCSHPLERTGGIMPRDRHNS